MFANIKAGLRDGRLMFEINLFNQVREKI